MLDVYVYDSDISRHVSVQKYCFTYFIQNNIQSEIRCITDNVKEAGEVFSKAESQSIFIISCDEHTDFLINSLRKGNRESYLIIVANDFNDILQYMKPGHNPSGFILRPMTQDDINKLIGDIISDYTSKKKEHGFGCFTFKSKSTEYSIPFESILSFESGNKKIIVKTSENEYSFYGTLDEIQNNLPDGFIRIHKSFIINIAWIKQIDYSDSKIILNNGNIVYFSRTYRNIIKELFNIGTETVS